MIKELNFNIPELSNMKKYPKELFSIGNTKLLEKKKISIIGTRRPNSYTKEFTHKLASRLSALDICVVSGAAMGVDAISHQAAKPSNTIAVVANGLDIRYPAVNKNLISKIEEEGLVISAYKAGEKARNYTFVLRNEIVVALGDILIVTQADLNSGSLTSVKYALAMKKKIYTLPHRINESLGTQNLVKDGFVEPIYDIDEFISMYTDTNNIKKHTDEILTFCQNNPSYEEAVLKFGNKIFEYELEGKIKISNAKVSLF
jgi:DNA processing protein